MTSLQHIIIIVGIDLANVVVAAITATGTLIGTLEGTAGAQYFAIRNKRLGAEI
ncbi:hypothetical protein [Nocardia seriolae]|uniref:Uncharacterized protein n=1 Tax=Nocardia seriolae TaxID=37332 RepID=A0ABC8AV26_9NOCA|nr:hypothetical protein [Nocardia seriolae]APA98005.1 hypothetical protein NS506_03956 [Nocardia seriolae]QOW36076.1 hypothetical protein IMZ23_14995 [Nocardia seriolae]QUN16428.1 hypothetical protein KEC46_29955 [Nocardia seriolae]WKY50023.1 hypothetical protein Q5P07_23500 [Nocardia seriolae]WNJ56513.1 hypothetical protein RMO66_23790 [Nocardia seriolae]